MQEKEDECITLTEADVIEVIKSLNNTKQEIFKLIVHEGIKESIKSDLLALLIKIDEGLIRRVGYRSSFEVKTYNKVIS
ncbi:hypothetical protein DFQ01_12119 [Paenibacillus cellulosilyticus]|uniref:Uncharacterized protein n=1 Tax=Paenibacillus cellulosilyticus TaxID=375489 RepID=A0A2V2YNS4_9BACL|nr:hypothetical protein [Paenibacillus cellulosilyticus]PWV97377.1 hypothetical protein DFQ01_12119 [Paenibacillus cellulosilyticus]QKS48579.1 hypothetical protein HUB94_30580 [Paenibacillus cellulosilyticus]